MSQIASREKPALPQRWADEIAHASPSKPPKLDTSPARVFDVKLDGFLDRFQTEIGDARALKEALDQSNADTPDYAQRKQQFKAKMDRIRTLFTTEGEDFVESLSNHNPKLSMAAGSNTIELAEGIERLETAFKEEETKRARKQIAKRAVENLTPEQSVTHSANAERSPVTVGHTLGNLNSEETLQLMQSDIQALKLELLRLQRSKETTPTYKGHPLSLPPKPPVSLDTAIFSSESVTRETDDKALPPSLLANNVSVVRVTGRANGMAPTYVSHLEQMKSRLEALEKKPLSRRAKSAARLGRTHTMGSMYDHVHDENQPQNVTAMVTPPRASRRMNQRSISTQSPPNYHRYTPPKPERFIQVSSPNSTPSPGRKSVKRNEKDGSPSPAKLFFDAPEDLLARPQSHAAARDIQRYSLKVARRFGPTENATHGSPEPRSRSVATVSPRRKMNGEGNGIGHTLSDVGNTVVVNPPSTIDTSGSGGRVVEEIQGDMWVRKGVVWKRWRRRYATIVSHNFFGRVMCLFCYSYSSGGSPKTRSQIVVLQGALCRAVRDKVEIGGQQRYMFVVRTTSKEYYFAAESDEDRRNWIREIREAAKNEAVKKKQGIITGGRSMAFRNRFS